MAAAFNPMQIMCKKERIIVHIRFFGKVNLRALHESQRKFPLTWETSAFLAPCLVEGKQQARADHVVP